MWEGAGKWAEQFHCFGAQLVLSRGRQQVSELASILPSWSLVRSMGGEGRNLEKRNSTGSGNLTVVPGMLTLTRKGEASGHDLALANSLCLLLSSLL